MAFEEEGFTVVRGPDVLWGGDIRRFHPPSEVFDGVIGGPPCQSFSPLARLVASNGHTVRFGNLIPEFERCVQEAAPRWFLMENVPTAPEPIVDPYIVRALMLNNRWVEGAPAQNRLRRFSFGTLSGVGLAPDVTLFEAPYVARTVTSNSGGRGAGQKSAYLPMPAVTAAHSGNGAKYGPMPAVTSSDGAGRGPKMQGWRYKLPDACRYQGLPENFLEDAPFTAEGKLKAVANGVPLPMGRAIARAVKRAVW